MAPRLPFPPTNSPTWNSDRARRIPTSDSALDLTPLLDRRLVFVTGKGGVGKTSIAAALGLLAARRGLRTLVVDIDGGADLGARFEAPPVGYEPRELQASLFGMAMTTEDALREYLRIRLRVPIAAPLGPLARVFDFVSTAAPGVREILTVGKIAYEVRERMWDLVVVDAPATGHVLAQLAAPDAITRLVPVGPLQDESAWILDILGDASLTGAVIVSQAQEMPVLETIGLAESLASETVVDLAAVVVNRVLPELFGRAEQETFEHLAAESRRRTLAEAAGGDLGPLIEAARLAVGLRRSDVRHLERLRAGLPKETDTIYLPHLFGRHIGLRLTAMLADALADELG